MKLDLEREFGRARPRFVTERDPDRPTYGPAVQRVARNLGMFPMPWQTYASNLAGEVNDDGSMRYSLVVMLVPRRGGKTGLVLPTSIQRAAIDTGQRILYTAQTRQDAVDKYRDDWLPIIGQSRYERLLRARLSNGSEGLYLPNRSSVRLFAPGPKGAHGKDVDRATVDEGWAFTREAGAELEAGVRPAMLTRLRRQFEVISAGGTDESTYLLDYVEMGRASVGRANATIAYIDFSADEETDDLDNPATVLRTHPAIGHTVRPEVIEEDRQTMTPDLFYRSYLNVFTGAAGTRAVPRLGWSRAANGDIAPEEHPRLFTFDVHPDRTSAAIATAGMIDGRRVQRLVDHRPGVDWLIPRLVELQDRYRARLIADGAGPSIPIVSRLRAIGRVVETLDLRQYAAACGGVLDAVLADDPQLVHAAQPALDDSAAGIAKRSTGDGFVWSRTKSTGDPTPFVAFTIADWAAIQTRTSRVRVVHAA